MELSALEKYWKSDIGAKKEINPTKRDHMKYNNEKRLGGSKVQS